MSRIKQLRESGKLSQKQLADMLFVNQTAVSQWERGVTTPSPSALLSLCELFGNNDGLTSLARDLQGAEPRLRKKGVMVPVYGRVAAGIPIEAIEDILDYEEITEEMARAGTFFALKVQGASMSPDIKDGDVIIVRQQPDIESGEIAVVIVNGFDATVKR
jgi:repressor LexA